MSRPLTMNYERSNARLSACQILHLMCLPATVVDKVGGDSRPGHLGAPLIPIDHNYIVTKSP
jgi:hypothetical protein